MNSLKKVLNGLDRNRMIELTKNFVNIPSPTGEEEEIGLYLAEELKKIGMQVALQEVEPHRHNVIGRLKGNGGGPTLMYCGHFDTSTTGKEEELSGIGYKPEAKIVDDTWIYGLGVANMKNAFSAYITAVEMLLSADIDLLGDILITGVVGEIEKAPIGNFQGKEYRGGGLGAKYLMSHGVTADMCIIGEPTGLRLQIGNMGYIFARITTKGVAHHTFCKHLGIDALEKMLHVIKAVKKWEPQYQRKYSHDFMKPMVGIGAIQAGYPFKPAICPPPYCHLFLDVRTLPGVTPMEIRENLENLLCKVKTNGQQIEYDLEFYLVSDGYELSKDEYLVKALSDAHLGIFGSKPEFPEPERYAVSSDGNVISKYGVPTVTYGAAGITNAGVYAMLDDRGEALKIDNLANCTKVYASTALNICTKTKEEIKHGTV